MSFLHRVFTFPQSSLSHLVLSSQALLWSLMRWHLRVTEGLASEEDIQRVASCIHEVAIASARRALSLNDPTMDDVLDAADRAGYEVCTRLGVDETFVARAAITAGFWQWREILLEYGSVSPEELKSR